jgi:hypothetical protein
MPAQFSLRPYDTPELRHSGSGDWWAIGCIEGSIRNSDGSLRMFSVEVGMSITPHGDYIRAEPEYWRLVAEKLPLIAEQLAAGATPKV